MKTRHFLADEQIISLYFNREEAAIDETARKYGSYLLTIAQNILKDHENSKECVNDAYWKTWNTIPPTRPEILRAFLAKITRHTALDRYDEARRHKRIPQEKMVPLSDVDGVLTHSVSPQEELENRELGRIISAYLQTVSDRRLYIFLHRYFYMTPIANIAKKLGCSQSTVHKELVAMKQELRRRLVQEGYEV